MTTGSNTAARIAMLRKRIARNKGISARAFATANHLRLKGYDADLQIRADQAEIEAMGGRVRR